MPSATIKSPVAAPAIGRTSVRVAYTANLEALAATTSKGRYICAVRNAATERILEVRMDELLPQPTSALKLKIGSWVERTFAESLADFGTLAQRALEASG